MGFDNFYQPGHHLSRQYFDMAAEVESMRALNRPTKIETDIEQFRSFSSASGVTCPSLTSSLYSTDSSPLGDSRRLSVDSNDSFALDTFSRHYTSGTVSPSTPMTSSDLENSLTSGASMGCLPAEMNMSQLYTYQDASDPFWVQEGKLQGMTTVEPYESQHYLGQNQLRSYLPNQSQQLPTSTLSRGIFQEPHGHDDQEGLFSWTPTVHSTPPQTVAPSATFQTAFSSPHCYTYGPATPSPLRYHAPETPTLKSSPYSPAPYSPGSSYSSSLSSSDALRHIIDNRTPMTPCRPAKRTPRRQEPYKVAKSKQLLEYVEPNKFACDREDCIDKTGRRKAFKRSEHLKRHMNTCHSGRRDHVCWVEGCKKPFSRSDNLNTHLKQTHGRKSNGQRNRYVATLDENSPYYNPDYKGALDDEGRPVDIKTDEK